MKLCSESVQIMKRGLLFHISHSLHYGDLCPCGDSSEYSTSALTNLIALAGTFPLSGPPGSGRVWVVEDDDYPQPCLNEQSIKSTGSCKIKFTDL